MNSRSGIYKRMLFTTAHESLMTHDGSFGIRIRKSRNPSDPDGTFVIETDDYNERRRVDKLIELYDCEDVE